MTQKGQEIFLVEYDVKREFKEPDNLSNTSQNEEKPKINNKAFESQEEGQRIEDEFNQTPIHKYGTRQISNDSPQGSQAQQITRHQLQRNTVILQFKISQLQKICSTLTSTNSKLLDKIEELQQENDRQKSRIVELQRDVQLQQSQVVPTYYGRQREICDNDEVGNILNGDGDDSIINAKQSSIIISNRNNINNNSDSISQQQLQSQQNNILQQSSSQLQNQVSDIQQMIIEYREQLKKAQQVNKNNKLYYQGRIKQLQNTIDSLTQSVDSYNQLNMQLQERLHQLQGRNSILEEETQQLQQESISRDTVNNNNSNSNNNRQNAIIANIKQQNPINVSDDTPRSHYTPYNPKQSTYNPTSSFLDDDYMYTQSLSSTLQFELQKLIDKLVKQLQAQRGTKTKMGQQLKRIQSQLLASQKILIHKNQHIHQLQMQILNYEKANIAMSNNINKVPSINTNTTMINNNSNSNLNHRSQYLLNHSNTNNRFVNNSNNNLSNINNTNTLAPSPARLNKQIVNRKEYIANNTNNGSNINNNTNINNNKQSLPQRNPALTIAQSYTNKPQQLMQQVVSKPLQPQQQQKQQPIQQSSINFTKSTNSLNRQSTQKQLQPLNNTNNINTSPPTYFMNRQPQPQQQQFTILPLNPPQTSLLNPPQKRLLQTFSLMQLLHNPNINLSSRQKLYISLKLVLFYQQKLYQQQNYTLLSLENVLVTNFNQINLRLIIIRTNTSDTSSCLSRQSNNQAQSVQKLIENLAFLLNSILIDIPNDKSQSSFQGFSQTKEYGILKQKIQSILSGTNIQQRDLFDLKSMIESALQ